MGEQGQTWRAYQTQAPRDHLLAASRGAEAGAAAADGVHRAKRHHQRCRIALASFSGNGCLARFRRPFLLAVASWAAVACWSSETLLSSAALTLSPSVVAAASPPAVRRAFSGATLGSPSEHRSARSRTARYGAAFKGNQKSQKAIKQMQKKTTKQDEGTEKKKKDNVIEMDGTVMLHSRDIFKVELTNGAEVQCTLGGKLRMNKIKVLEGDRVTVEMSPFDLTRGRITFRSIDRSLLETPEEKQAKAREKAKEEAKLERQATKEGEGS